MNIDELTIGQLKQIKEMCGTGSVTGRDQHYKIGSNYFIRTVTHHFTGRLVDVTEHELVLEDVDWIADDGRFNEAVSKGEFAEVEPYPDGAKVLIGRGSIIDAHATDVPLKRVVV